MALMDLCQLFFVSPVTYTTSKLSQGLSSSSSSSPSSSSLPPLFLLYSSSLPPLFLLDQTKLITNTISKFPDKKRERERFFFSLFKTQEKEIEKEEEMDVTDN